MTPRPASAASNPTPQEGASRALLYLRVSTKEQAEMGGEAEGYSIPAQREACERKAESLGALVVDEFVDRGESARSARRPELQRMLAYVKEHPVDFVIVHKVDRLARNRIDDAEINLALQLAGVQLVSVSEAIDDTPSGTLLHGIMSTIAEWYSSNLSVEVKTKTLEKVRKGGTPFKAPIGYLNVREVVKGREARTVVVDEERAPLVRWAFETYATGEWSMRDLTSALDEQGLTTVASAHYGQKPLPLASVQRMLKNRYYIGKVVWRGAEYDGTHPPLISVDLFNQVQSVIEAHDVSGEKRRVHHHYLKGSVWCGRCGSRLIVSHATNRYGVTYAYFMCIGRHQRRNDCRQQAVPIELVEALVSDTWRNVELDADQRAELLDRLMGELASNRDKFAREKARALRRRQHLQEQQAKLLEAHYADAIPLELMREEQTRISREMQATDSRLAAADVSIEAVEATIRRCVAFMGSCHKTYVAAPEPIRRLMNQAVFERLEVDDGVITEESLTEPFQSLRGQVKRTAEVGTPGEDPGPGWLRDGDWWPAEEAEAIPCLADNDDQRSGQRHGREIGRGAKGLNAVDVVPPAGVEPALTAV